MNEFAQRVLESPKAWLSRLEEVEEEGLSLADRRLRRGYMADARRLLQEGEQRAKWDRDRR